MIDDSEDTKKGRIIIQAEVNEDGLAMRRYDDEKRHADTTQTVMHLVRIVEQHCVQCLLRDPPSPGAEARSSIAVCCKRGIEKYTTFSRQRVPFCFRSTYVHYIKQQADVGTPCIGDRCRKEQVAAKAVYLMRSCRSFVLSHILDPRLWIILGASRRFLEDARTRISTAPGRS